MIADIGLADGESGCDLVTEAHKRSGTPALFVTGSPEKAERCDTAIGVLVKPFGPHSLTASIEVAAEIMKGKIPTRIPAELRLFPEFRLAAVQRSADVESH